MGLLGCWAGGAGLAMLAWPRWHSGHLFSRAFLFGAFLFTV
jgi:hypothetical protein